MGSEYTRSFRYPQRKNQLGLGLGCREASWSQPSGRWFSPNFTPSQDRLSPLQCGEPYPAGSSKYQESSSFEYRDELTPKHGDVIGCLDCLSLPLFVLEEMGSKLQRSLVAETHPDGYLFPGLKTLVSRIRLLIWPDTGIVCVNGFQVYFPCLVSVFMLQCSPSISPAAAISIKSFTMSTCISSEIAIFVLQVLNDAKLRKIDFSEKLTLQTKL